MVNQEYLTKHELLILNFEHMIVLFNQMSGKIYSSMDIYINNCNHLRDLHIEASKILADKAFLAYIIKNDPDLYYNFQSMIIALRVICNLINNLNEVLIKKSMGI